MIDVLKSSTFNDWLNNLKDLRARAKVQARIDRVATGNFGDAKSVGDGVSELRIDYGQGYRVYFLRYGVVLVVLLCSGDKSSQAADIEKAKRLAAQWREESK